MSRIEFANEDFGEAGFCGRSGRAVTPTLRIVNGESRLVEIAFPLKAGLFHKFLIVRIVRNGGQLAAGVESPNPLQVHIKKAICARKQAGSFGRSVLAECNDERDRCHNQQDS